MAAEDLLHPLPHLQSPSLSFTIHCTHEAITIHFSAKQIRSNWLCLSRQDDQLIGSVRRDFSGLTEGNTDWICCVCVCACVRACVCVWCWLPGFSVMLVISNLLWSQCISTGWGLKSCHWHRVCECAFKCMQVCVCVCLCVCGCVCGLWHFKKLCCGNVKTLHGVCVCVGVSLLSLSLSGETVCSLPQCIKAHSVALGEGRNSLSISTPSLSLSLSLSLSPCLHHPPPLPSSLSFLFSLWQGRCSPLAVSLSIFTVHFTLAPRWSAAASGESGAALAKCSCPLRTWMICCTTSSTLFLPLPPFLSLSLSLSPSHTHTYTDVRVGGNR